MDNKKNAIDALTSMANNIVNKKSDAAKLREVFYHVESALSSGVGREKVLETLRDTLGVKMTLKAFDKNLYTIRKKRKAGKLAETPKTNRENNTGPPQLDVSSDITAPAVTSTMKVDLATEQPISGEWIEKDKNHDNKEPSDVFKGDSWKDSMNGADIYNKLYALGDEHSKEQKRIEKEKKYEQARLKRLGKI